MKLILLVSCILILVLCLASPAHALSLEKLEIVVLENGDAMISMWYQLSVPEYAAISLNVTDPAAELKKAVENNLGRPVDVIVFRDGFAQLNVQKFAEVRTQGRTITLVTQQISFARAEAAIKGKWYTAISSPDLSPQVTQIIFPDGYVETFNNQITIPPVTHTLTRMPDKTDRYVITTEGIDIRTTAQGQQDVTIDLARVRATGAVVTVSRDRNVVVVQHQKFSLAFHGERITATDTTVTGTVKSINLSTVPLSTDFSIGPVSGFLEATLASLPRTGAAVTNTLSETIDPSVKGQLNSAAQKAGLNVHAVAYTFRVEKSSVDARGLAIVTMTVPKRWTDWYGGVSDLTVIRLGDDRSVQVLQTQFLGIDEKGEVVIAALSPQGPSVFGMLTAKATAMKNPNAPPPRTAIGTVAGMALWFVTTTPGLVSLACVMVLVGIFGYRTWKRRSVPAVPGAVPETAPSLGKKR